MTDRMPPTQHYTSSAFEAIELSIFSSRQRGCASIYFNLSIASSSVSPISNRGE